MSIFQHNMSGEFDVKSLSFQPEFLQLMARLAHFGILKSQYKEAGVIIDMLRTVRPDSDIPFIPLGMLHFAQHQFRQACEAFMGAIEKNPENDFAKAHLAMVLRRIDARKESDALIEEILEANREPEIVAFAKEIRKYEPKD